ncbi:unnamed protein product [Rhizoctonia solani]|uniref:Uncharacterized protein n=1 Tax=Rhizoctonia solani TaxID=456999 RepID=A0A8H3GRI9_9AGAM|nr:unnamed protein product [Rhizoctonia solani]
MIYLFQMKCIYEDGANICQRCKQKDKSESCVVEYRKRGPAPSQRELLMREIASRDQLIDSLLRQIHNPGMCTPINWPPTVPVPQQPTNTDRPLDQDVVAWIESTRQYRPPTLTGSIDARNNQGHTHLVSEPITSSTNVHPDDNAVSFGDNDSKVKDKGVSRLLVPAELRQDSAEIDDQLHLIDGTTAVGPIAKLSLGLDQRGSDAGMTGDAKEENEWVQVGNLTSFQTGSSANPEWRPVISERQISPEILTGGIIKPNEVVKVLFEELNVSGSKHENESARDGDGSYDGWVWVADDWE